MQLVAEAVAHASVVLAGQIHGGERRYADLQPGAPREQRRLHVERGLLPDQKVEAIGARRRLAVEQRVDGGVIAPGDRRLHPEFSKEGEGFLRGSGFDAEGASGEAILLVSSKEAEIAGAEEGDRLVVHIRIIDRKMQAEAREASVDRQRLFDLQSAIFEKRRRIGDRRGDAVADRVHRHRAAVEKAQMKGFESETAVDVRKERMIRLEADVAPGVVVQRIERGRQLRRHVLERRLREAARALEHVVEAEFRRWSGALAVGWERDLRACGRHGADHPPPCDVDHSLNRKSLGARAVTDGAQSETV